VDRRSHSESHPATHSQVTSLVFCGHQSFANDILYIIKAPLTTAMRNRRSAILKIVNLPYLKEKSSDFNEIWYITADLELRDNHVIKYVNF